MALTRRSEISVSLRVMTRSSVWLALCVGSVTCCVQPNDYSSCSRRTALTSSARSTWTLKSPQATTGQLFGDSRSNTADSSSKISSDNAWLAETLVH